MLYRWRLLFIPADTTCTILIVVTHHRTFGFTANTAGLGYYAGCIGKFVDMHGQGSGLFSSGYLISRYGSGVHGHERYILRYCSASCQNKQGNECDNGK